MVDSEARKVGPEVGAVPPEVALWEIYATDPTKVEDLSEVKIERPSEVGVPEPGTSGV